MSTEDAAIQNQSPGADACPPATAAPSAEIESGTTAVAIMPGYLLQAASGFAVYLPFIRFQLLDHLSEPQQQAWLGLMAACLLLGLGLGFALQPRIRVNRGPTAAVRFAVVSALLSVSACLVWLHPLALTFAALLAGLGLFGEWTPAAELTRRGLSTTRLWTGMRIHAAMFLGGGTVAAVVAAVHLTESGREFGVLPAFALICAVILRRLPDVTETLQDAAIEQSLESGFPSPVPGSAERMSNPNEPATEEDCDAEECCGGGCTWRPMPAWQGVCFVTIGMYVIGGLLLPLVFTTQGGVPVLCAAGAMFGIVVFQAVVPATGYAVLLLSTSLCGCILLGAACAFPTSGAIVIVTLISALAACLFCGCSGVIGESFVEGRIRKGRSAILMLGCLAAAAFAVLIQVVIPILLNMSPHWVHLAGCLLLIALIRQIPSPVLSQRRQDEMTQSEASEILAADPEILQDSLE